MDFREIKVQDYNEVLTLVNHFQKTQFTKEQFADFILQNNSHTMVLVNSDKIIGIATIIIEQKLIHNYKMVGHIEDVIVHKDYRGNGYGKILINNLVNFAKTTYPHIYKIILDCNSDNIGFYKKCGFEQKNKQMSIYLQ